MRHLTWILVAAAVAAGSTARAQTVIDFSAVAAGAVLDNQLAAQGVRIVAKDGVGAAAFEAGHPKIGLSVQNFPAFFRQRLFPSRYREWCSRCNVD